MLSVVGRSVESDERGVRVQISESGQELRGVLRGWSMSSVAIESVMRRQRTSFHSTSLTLSFGVGTTQTSCGQGEDVADFERSSRIDTEELSDGGGEGDGRVGSTGGSGHDEVRISRMFDNLHQSLWNVERSQSTVLCPPACSVLGWSHSLTLRSKKSPRNAVPRIPLAGPQPQRRQSDVPDHPRALVQRELPPVLDR